MKTRFVIFLLLFLAVSQVHALSTEVKVDLLTHKITAALNAKNYAQAVALFKEYDALDVAMPPALLLQRARVYFHEKDYLKTLNTLEKYLEDAERGSAEYNQALAMYADVEGKPELQQIRQAQEAQEQARQVQEAQEAQEALRNAAIRAREGNLCSGEGDEFCYVALDNPRGCYIFLGYYYESREYEWQGECAHGFAHGNGAFRTEGSENKWWEETGSVDVHGLFQGLWKGVNKNGDRWEVPYVNGKAHGHDKQVDSDGDRWEVPYVNGKRHGTVTWHKANGKTYYWCYRNGKEVKKGPC